MVSSDLPLLHLEPFLKLQRGTPSASRAILMWATPSKAVPWLSSVTALLQLPRHEDVAVFVF